jgi:hypothetical protein
MFFNTRCPRPSQLPRGTGTYALECHCWRPSATLRERLLQFFLGVPPAQGDALAVVDGRKRASLRTVGVGAVRLELAVHVRAPRSGKVIQGLAE